MFLGRVPGETVSWAADSTHTVTALATRKQANQQRRHPPKPELAVLTMASIRILVMSPTNKPELLSFRKIDLRTVALRSSSFLKIILRCLPQFSAEHRYKCARAVVAKIQRDVAHGFPGRQLTECLQQFLAAQPLAQTHGGFRAEHAFQRPPAGAATSQHLHHREPGCGIGASQSRELRRPAIPRQR